MDTNRSHRTLIERFMPGVKAYRCAECDHRFRHTSRRPLAARDNATHMAGSDAPLDS